MSEGRERGGEERISRRRVLVRGAAAGALAWSVPVLRSAPALAWGAPGTPQVCSRYYAVRLTRGTCQPLFPPRDPHVAEQEWGTGDVCDALVDWADDHPEVELEFPGREDCPVITASQPHLAWAVLLPAGALPGEHCQYVLGFGRAGNTCCEGYVDPSPPDPAEAGRRLIFPQCAAHAEISDIQLIYCCP